MEGGISTKLTLGGEELLLTVLSEGATALAGFGVFVIAQLLPGSFHIA
jgi:hypothetical protein